MNHNDTTIVCRKYGNLNTFCKFQLGEGVNAIFYECGPVPSKRLVHY